MDKNQIDQRDEYLNKNIAQENTTIQKDQYKVLNKRNFIKLNSCPMPVDPQFNLLDTIQQIQQQQHQVNVKGYYSAFIVHFILHLVPMLLLIFDEVLVFSFEERYTAEMIILAIVFQFWFTKNITGKRMLGCRWFFAEDQNGEERLFFQCRANPQHVDWVKPKLFWIVQFAYCLITVLEIIETIFMIPNAPKIDVRKIQLCLLLQLSGITNIFYFLKISDLILERQQVLHTRLGSDGLRKVGLGSIVSHY